MWGYSHDQVMHGVFVWVCVCCICVCFVIVLVATDCGTIGAEQSAPNEHKLSSKWRPTLSEPHYFPAKPNAECLLLLKRLLNVNVCVWPRIALGGEEQSFITERRCSPIK